MILLVDISASFAEYYFLPWKPMSTIQPLPTVWQ